MTRFLTICAMFAIIAVWVATTANSPDGESVTLACIVTAITYALLAIANRDN